MTTIETPDIVKIIIGIAGVLNASLFISKMIHQVATMFSKPQPKDDMTFLRFGSEINLFTQPKYVFMRWLFVGLPIVMLLILLFSHDFSRFSDVFLISICPSMILFYFCTKYCITLILTATERNQYMWKWYLEKRTGQTITLTRDEKKE